MTCLMNRRALLLLPCLCPTMVQPEPTVGLQNRSFPLENVEGGCLDLSRLSI